MLAYILKVSICWLAFYAVYFAFLRKETFFKTNRIYLLATLGIGALIPVLEKLIDITPTETVLYYMPPIDMDALSEQFAVVAQSSDSNSGFINWLSILFVVYAIGVLVSLARFIYGLSKIYRLYKAAKLESNQNFCLVKGKTKHLPFSFFSLLFISDQYELSQEDKEKIILHESAHIQGGHSFDVILLELLAIVFWCSPLIYFYKKSIKAVHEFLADDRVLQTTSTQSYGQLLLGHSQAGIQFAMANHFIHSQLKQRIIMMTRNKSTRKNLMKYTLMLPVLFLLFNIFAQKDVASASSVSSESYVNSELSIPTDANLNIEVSDTSKVYKKVDQMPRFPGCEEEADDKKKCAQTKMLEFIYTNIKYPKEARENGIQGTTVIRFIIEPTGKIKDAKIVRKIGGGCDEEALRVVNTMPDWIPGEQDGEKVNVQFNLPVKFKLSDDELFDHVVDLDQKVKDANGNEIFKVRDFVETVPTFPGCENLKEGNEKCANKKMEEFITNNLRYPSELKGEKKGGLAVVKFTVDTEGDIKNAHVIKSSEDAFDKEALRVVNMMPKWNPGVAKDKKMNVSFSIPIIFNASMQH